MDGPPTQALERSAGRRARGQRLELLAALLAIPALVCWLQWRALGSARDTHATAIAQLTQMRADSEHIKELRQAPKTATSRTRPNEELLAQVEKALAAARVERSKWHDSVPQPPVRLPQSDYSRMTTRLYFEAVTLKELAAFAHHLQSSDSTLQVSAVNLANRQPEIPSYDVDVALSYLVYAPRERDEGLRRP